MDLEGMCAAAWSEELGESEVEESREKVET